VTGLRRVQQALERRGRQQSAVAELGQLALEGGPLDALLEHACRLVCQTLGHELAKVLEMEGDNRSFLLRAGVGWKEGLVGKARVAGRSKSQAGATVLRGGPILVPELTKERRFPAAPLLEDHGVASGLSVPIGPPDKPWGVLGSHSTKLRELTDEDADFLQAIAHVLWSAIARQQSEAALRENEERLRLAQQAGGVGTWHWTLDDDVAGGSEEYYRIHGLEKDAPLTLNSYIRLIHPDDRALFNAAIERALAGEPGRYEAEFRIIRPDGRVRWIAGRGRAFFRRGKPFRMLGVNLDVTDRKNSEDALRESGGRLQESLGELESIYRTAAVGLCVIDSRECVVRVNSRLAAFEESTVEAMAGRRFVDALPKLSAILRPHVARVLATSAPMLDLELDLPSAGASAQRSWQVSLTPLPGEGLEVEQVVCVVQDVTERKKTEATLADYRRTLEHRVVERTKKLLESNAALREREDQLLQLTDRLIHSQEENQRWLARELHDVFSQRLATLALQIGKIGDEAGGPPEELLKDAGAAREQVEALSVELHDLARQLHPSIVEDLGLVTALRELVRTFRQQHPQLEVVFRAGRLTRQPPTEAKLCIYRIAQECLTNVRKHSKAQRADVTLQQQKGSIVLTVIENGEGFDVETARRQRGLGLVSMQERARQVGGEFRVDSDPGRGSRVVVQIPLGKPRRNRK